MGLKASKLDLSLRRRLLLVLGAVALCATVLPVVANEGVSAAAGPPPAYYPSGPQTNVPESSLTGWKPCFSGDYSQMGNISSILAACDGDYLLLAGGPMTSPTFDVVAAAPRNDVLFDTHLGNTPHDANGTGWYFTTDIDPVGSGKGWGFAPQGEPIDRSPGCDLERTIVDNRWPVNEPDRLCWNTNGNNLLWGWRSGSNIFLNSATDFRRVIFEPGTLPSVQVSVGDASIVEGDGTNARTLKVPVYLSEPSTTAVSVGLTLTPGNATGGGSQLPNVDYKRKPITRTVWFKPNPKTHLTPVFATVGISIYPDQTVEVPEAFGVSLYNVSFSATIGRRAGSVGLIDDDPVSGVVVSAGDVAAVEGNSGARTASAPITLSAAQAEDITVDYVITGQSATCAKVVGASTPAPGVDCNDFGGVVRHLKIKRGQALNSVSVKLYPDAVHEGTETVAVTLLGAHPTNVASPLTVHVGRSGTVTVLDDDPIVTP